jgi:uncharacterized protein YndB with AHSA1/START domain
MTQATLEAVRREITVQAPPERAFAVFTERFDTWWPRAHKIGGADLKEAVIERRQGGRWYEIDTDGSTCEWGEVLAYDPPTRLLLTWQIGSDWKYHADQASEVEVTFTPQGESTHVVLEHRHLERHGEGAERLRDSVSADGGWPSLLKLYSEALAAELSSESAAELMQ